MVKFILFPYVLCNLQFFGFRNTFVQRLLRELVANVGGTTEQSSLPSNFSGEACETIYQCKPSNPYPNLPTNLVKSSPAKGKRSRNDRVVSSKRLNGNHVKQHAQEENAKTVTSSTSKKRDLPNGRSSDLPTFAAANEVSSHAKGKRSRNDRIVRSKRLNGSHVEQHAQEENTKTVTSSTSKQRDLSNGSSRDLPTSAAANEVSRDYFNPGPENSLSVIEKEKCLPTAERDMQLDSLEISNNLKVREALSKEEQSLPVPINNFGPESVDIENMQQKQEPVSL